MSRRRGLAAIACTVAVFITVSGCKFDGAYDLPLPGRSISASDGFDITGDFKDVLNVVPKSPVMVNDIPVGQVLEVRRSGWQAKVTMRLRNNVKLPANAEASIEQTSLLGEKYIALRDPAQEPNRLGSNVEVTPAAAVGRLKQGDNIPLARTGSNPEVEDILGALSMLLSGGGIGQLKTITTEVNALMTNRTGEMRDVLRRLNSFVGAIDAQKGDLIKAMESINSLSKTLNSEKATIDAALQEMGPAVEVLRRQHANLMTMLRELDRLGDVGTRVINKTKENLIAQLRHLEPVLRKLADTGPELVPGLLSAASYPFPLEAMNAIKGDYANVVFKLQIKLTPVTEGGLLPRSIEDLQRLCEATPLAPVCSQLGLKQFCDTLGGALPLCTASGQRTALTNLRELKLGAAVAPLPPLLGGSDANPSSGDTTSTPPDGVGGLLGEPPRLRGGSGATPGDPRRTGSSTAPLAPAPTSPNWFDGLTGIFGGGGR